MQENTMQNLVPKATRTPFFLSLFFAGLIIFASIAIFIMDRHTEGNIEDTMTLMQSKDAEIADLKKDKRVIITDIVKSGTVKTSLDLRGIVNNFRDAASRSNVRLKGFSIAQDVISTSLISTQADPIGHPDPASTIITMMRAYENPNGIGTFRLDPISSISGDMRSRTTSIQFRIVSNK